MHRISRTSLMATGWLFALHATAIAGFLTDNPIEGSYHVQPGTSPTTRATNATIGASGVVIDFNLYVDYLVVGGGGGGGTSTAFSTAGSGGGGGGGVMHGTTLAIDPLSYSIAVGQGGAPGALGNNSGANGGNSQFGTIVGFGGGGGAGGNANGLNGGSGGGGRGNGTSGGTATQPAVGGLGFGGGTGTGNQGAGGGGGAGGSGFNASGDNGGGGGLGFASGISGASQFYAGGGGGGGRSGGTPGSGGSGVGGVGANNSLPSTQGLLNTGGGGGGGNNDRQGSIGGSGIVIVRYSGPQIATGGNSITTVNGDTVHTFTSTGAAALDFSAVNRTIIVSGNLDGTGSLEFVSPGTLVLSGNNSYTGGTIIEQGTIRLGSATALGASGSSVAINSSGTLDINGVNTNASGLYAVTLNGGTITNTGGGQQNALRFVSITADSTFTATNRWDIRGAAANDRGLLDTGGHTITKTGSNVVSLVNLDITGNGTINVNGGTLGLTRSLMNGGTVNVNSGSLFFENNSIGDHVYGMDVNLNGATVRSSGGNTTTISGLLTLTGTQAQNIIQVDNNRFTLAGGISGTGGFTKTGGGILTLLTANTHSGVNNLNGGTVEVGNDQAFGSGTLDLRSSAIRSTDATDRTIGNFVSLSSNTTFGSAGTGNLTFTGDMNKGGAQKTIDIQNEVTTFTGTISGSSPGAMIKTGPGLAVFNGDVTYPGATNVVEGTLEINGTVTNSPVTVLTNGRLSGTGAINSNLTIIGGTLAPGVSSVTGLGTLNVGGNLAFASTWEVNLDGTDFGQLSLTGEFTTPLSGITLAPGATFNPITNHLYWMLDNQGPTNFSLGDLFANMTGPGTGPDLLGSPASGFVDLNGILFAAYINSALDGGGNLIIGNGIVLLATPEPGRALLLAVATLGLLLRRRR